MSGFARIAALQRNLQRRQEYEREFPTTRNRGLTDAAALALHVACYPLPEARYVPRTPTIAGIPAQIQPSL